MKIINSPVNSTFCVGRTFESCFVDKIDRLTTDKYEQVQHNIRAYEAVTKD